MKDKLVDSSNYQWNCECCGILQTGLPMAFAYKEPHNWLSLSEDVKNQSALDEDFCTILHEDGQVERYIRCVMPFDVLQTDEQFGFGVWMSVSAKSMKIYESGFKTGKYEEPDCFGFMMHSLPGYPDTWALEASIVFGDGKLRPLVYLNKNEHPLYHDQQRGLTLEYLISLVVH